MDERAFRLNLARAELDFQQTEARYAPNDSLGNSPFNHSSNALHDLRKCRAWS